MTQFAAKRFTVSYDLVVALKFQIRGHPILSKLIMALAPQLPLNATLTPIKKGDGILRERSSVKYAWTKDNKMRNNV